MTKRTLGAIGVLLATVCGIFFVLNPPLGEASFLSRSSFTDVDFEPAGASVQDKVSISLGRRLMNLDDVRLGDYTIREDEEIVSVGHEELETVLKLVLDMRGKALTGLDHKRGSIGNLKRLEATYHAVFPVERQKARAQKTIWDREDQLAIDATINHNFDLLQANADAEAKSLLLYLKAQHLISNKKEREGEELLERLASEFPGSEYQMRSEGELAFRSFIKKDYGNAIERSNKILGMFPDTRASQDALYFLGRAYHMSNSHDPAVQNFDRLISKYRNNKWNEGAKYFRAKSHYFQRNWATAIGQFEDFIATHPTSVYKDDARELIARAYAQNQQFEKAIDAFEAFKRENTSVLDQMVADRHIYLYAKSAHGSRLRSADRIGAKHFETVLNDYEGKLKRYLTNYPSDDVVVAQTMFDLSQYYINNGDPNGAILYLEKLKDAKYSTLRGSTKKGDPTEANYGKIHHFQISYNLARAYLEKGDAVRVHRIKEEFAKNNNLHYYYLVRLAEISQLEKKRQFPEAMQGYLALYEDRNTSSRIKANSLFQLGNIYYSQHLKDEAKRSFQRVVDEFPNEPFARNAQNMVSFLNSRVVSKSTIIPQLKK